MTTTTTAKEEKISVENDVKMMSNAVFLRKVGKENAWSNRFLMILPVSLARGNESWLQWPALNLLSQNIVFLVSNCCFLEKLVKHLILCILNCWISGKIQPILKPERNESILVCSFRGIKKIVSIFH